METCKGEIESCRKESRFSTQRRELKHKVRVGKRRLKAPYNIENIVQYITLLERWKLPVKEGRRVVWEWDGMV